MLNLLITLAISLTAVAPTEMPDNFSPVNNDYSRAVTQLEEAIKNLPPIVEEPVKVKPPIDLSRHSRDEVACSCVLFVATKLKLPPIHTPADLEPNTNMWEAKAVLLDYKLPHIAYVEKIDNEGIWVHESNFKKCQIGRRIIQFNNPAIRGFWKS